MNPLGQIIELAHNLVFGEIPPILDWVYTTVFVLAILFGGYFYFKKNESKIVEQL
jgi:ABC-type polysaccharide/polyol phosphate export permease